MNVILADPVELHDLFRELCAEFGAPVPNWLMLPPNVKDCWRAMAKMSVPLFEKMYAKNDSMPIETVTLALVSQYNDLGLPNARAAELAFEAVARHLVGTLMCATEYEKLAKMPKIETWKKYVREKLKQEECDELANAENRPGSACALVS